MLRKLIQKPFIALNFSRTLAFSYDYSFKDLSDHKWLEYDPTHKVIYLINQ